MSADRASTRGPDRRRRRRAAHPPRPARAQERPLDRAASRLVIDALEAAATDEAMRAVSIGTTGPDFCAGADWVATNTKDGAPAPHRQHPAPHARAGPPADRAPHGGAAPGRVRRAGLGRRPRLPDRPRRRLHRRRRRQPLLGAVPRPRLQPRQRRHLAAAPAGRRRPGQGAAAARAQALRRRGRRVGADPPGRARRPSSTPRPTPWSSRLATGPTVAIGLTKRSHPPGPRGLARRGDGDRGQRPGADARAAADFKEGLAAFRESRPPRFEGR